MKTRIAALILGAALAMPAAVPAQGTAPMSDGEIRKVDKSAGKVTIKHGPIPNLDMPPMTMVFRVKEAAWLDQMKAGDRIRFRAEPVSGAFTVVEYEIVK